MEYFIRDNEAKVWIPVEPICKSLSECHEVIDSMAGGNYSIFEGSKTVCLGCGSLDVEQQLSMMIPVDCDITTMVEQLQRGGYDRDDYFYCPDCEDSTEETTLFEYMRKPPN